MTEIPEDVIEKAARRMYEERVIGFDQDGGDDWDILPDDWREEWVDGARAAGGVIWAAAREQALAEAVEAALEKHLQVLVDIHRKEGGE